MIVLVPVIVLNESSVFDAWCSPPSPKLQVPTGTFQMATATPDWDTTVTLTSKGKMSKGKREECHKVVTTFTVKGVHPFSVVKAL